jgi:hypothetical protein
MITPQAARITRGMPPAAGREAAFGMDGAAAEAER